MTELKATPGPWERSSNEVSILRPAKDSDKLEIERLVALVYSNGAPLSANAHLIAAAPELYAALVRLGTTAAAKYGNSDDELWGAITQGIAACAKARGEA